MAGSVIRYSVLLFLFAFNASQAQQLGFSLEAKLSSPAVEFSKLTQDWVVDHDGTHSYAMGRLDSWFEVNDRWRVGFVKRADYLLEYSKETAEFYTRLEDNELEAGVYDLDLRVNGLMSQGIYARYQIPINFRGHLGVTLYGLQGSIVQLGTLSGSGEVFENGDFEYQYDLNYYFDHSRLLNSPEENVSGVGYALDIDLVYSLGRHWSLKGSIKDLANAMYWSTINRDQGCVSRPASGNCFGVTSVTTKRQVVSSQSKWMIYGLKGVVRPYVQWQSWGRSEAWIAGVLINKYSIGWDLNQNVANFTYDSDRLRVKWGFDHVNVNDAHQWHINIETVWPIH